MAATCSVCAGAEAKYRCPVCSAETCSLGCVRGHKARTGCVGLRAVPAAPAAGAPREYTEAMFVQDYGFLERVNDFAVRTGDAGGSVRPGRRDPRQRALRAVQEAARLKGLQALPGTFRRAVLNRTRLVPARGPGAGATEDEVEWGSARKQHVAWTLELLELGVDDPAAPDAVLQRRVLDDVLDTQSLRALLPDTARRCFVREEERGAGAAWREIGPERWAWSLARVLEGRCFIEFPSIAYRV